ncbi:cobyric acid synthase [Tepidicaulis sp. LMO-SS28]|uniref:cobyric acid synthase n=1 Tax=Tepidicaulis sp. LMO-SS28 TaxID=3447455 RepID=UPI003EE03EE6
MSAALMLQGTGSDVGKSVLVAGLARAFTRRGLKVLPFKPQNMSNNAAVTEDGGEIGRAQALQAFACGVAPRTDMNPVLIKPQSDTGAQIVLQGKVIGSAAAREYQARKALYLEAVLESYARLSAEADLVLVEGAGSPAETNLRAGDIANMGFATAAGVPVLLIGDIDRGGVIASLAGTHQVISRDDRALIQGFLINKFRGDVRLFDEGLADITRHTGWRSFGVLPWLAAARRLPAEDAVILENAAATGDGKLRIAVPLLSRIANFDDFDALRAEPSVDLGFVPPGTPLPRDADLILLPGTKATIADMAFLKEQGWDIDILAHHRQGGRVMGICGGYQLLGRRIRDPHGIEGSLREIDGLGLLDVETELQEEKHLGLVTGASPEGHGFEGYEIHNGRTDGPDTAQPLLFIDGKGHGARSGDGRVSGCYIHGLFNKGAYRSSFLKELGARASQADHETHIHAALDEMAEAMEEHLDLDAMLQLAGRGAVAAR